MKITNNDLKIMEKGGEFELNPGKFIRKALEEDRAVFVYYKNRSNLTAQNIIDNINQWDMFLEDIEDEWIRIQFIPYTGLTFSRDIYTGWFR